MAWSVAAAPWLSTSVVEVVITQGSTRKDNATTMRRIQPQTDSPVAVRAGLCHSTCSVYPAIHGA